MGEPSGTTEERWQMRTVPDALARRYVDEGWWTDESLGAVAASGLAAMSGAGFRVYSQVRPWSGTFAAN